MLLRIFLETLFRFRGDFQRSAETKIINGDQGVGAVLIEQLRLRALNLYEQTYDIQYINQLSRVFGEPMIRLNVTKGRGGAPLANNRPFPIGFSVAEPLRQNLFS